MESVMKKLAVLTLALATLTANAGFAQQQTGKAAAAGKQNSSKFAWGVAVGTVAVVGAVVGIVAATSSSSPSTFSH